MILVYVHREIQYKIFYVCDKESHRSLGRGVGIDCLLVSSGVSLTSDNRNEVHVTGEIKTWR